VTNPGSPLWRTTIHSMAMPFAIEIVRADPSLVGGPGPSEEECAAAVAAFHRDLIWADDVFSLWRDDTPVSRLARGEITVDDCPPAVGDVFAQCERYRELTDGAFDARRPDGVVDPSGIVKTWAVDRAAWRLESLGAAGWLVGASGDVLVSGFASGMVPWTVGIADPRGADDPQGGPTLDVVALGGGIDAPYRALATSGTAQHGEHIWNPATGLKESAFMQASVIGTDLVECDAWATAIIAGGADVAMSAQRRGLELLCIPRLASGADPAETVPALVSPGWPGAD
jgi:thiamine biosynthesis lipoprotein